MTAAGDDKVLIAAAAEFAEFGFDGATLRRIAQRCGMSTGSLFHRYPNKRELLKAAVAEGSVSALDYVSARLEGVTDPRQRLSVLLISHLETIHGENRDFTLMALREFYLLNKEERAEVVEARDRYEALWQSVLAQAADAGLVPRDPLFRGFLLGALNSTFSWFSPDSGLTIVELGHRYLAMVLVTNSAESDHRRREVRDVRPRRRNG